MRALRACAALLALAACNEDTPMPPVGAWVLQSDPSNTLEVDAEFNFYGQGPCNRYFGRFEVVDTGLIRPNWRYADGLPQSRTRIRLFQRP